MGCPHVGPSVVRKHDSPTQDGVLQKLVEMVRRIPLYLDLNVDALLYGPPYTLHPTPFTLHPAP